MQRTKCGCRRAASVFCTFVSTSNASTLEYLRGVYAEHEVDELLLELNRHALEYQEAKTKD
jgi:hypothetical protein